MISSELAPIAVFAYKRPRHLDRLLDSLVANPLFAHSRLFVYCDGARTAEDLPAVAETRAIVRHRVGTRGQIIESGTNKGLARSIISGVTELCDRFGRVIVLEDDLILHPGCLEFLNGALQRYAHDERVYHINAYRYPGPLGLAPDFCRITGSWGWATWRRAWSAFEPDATALERRIREARLISAMDFEGAFPYFRMLQFQARGRIDSWAIRWYASVLLRRGLSVYPNVSQVHNGGLDNSGVHCGTTSIYDVEVGAASMDWPEEVMEDRSTFRQLQAFFRSTQGTLPRRIARKVKGLLMSRSLEA